MTDFIPEKPTFALASTGKTYELRVPNLEDKVEFVRMCGGPEKIQKIFQERQWSEICKIVYRILIDKTDFIAQREKRISDEGIEEEVLITGPIRFLRAIQTQSEAAQMLGAFNAASMASEPLVKEFVENEVKKNRLNKSTGESSLISSPLSTDTHPPISEVLLTGS